MSLIHLATEIAQIPFKPINFINEYYLAIGIENSSKESICEIIRKCIEIAPPIIISIFLYSTSIKANVISKINLNQTKILEYKKTISDLISFSNESDKLFNSINQSFNSFITSSTLQQEYERFLNESMYLTGYTTYLLSKKLHTEPTIRLQSGLKDGFFSKATKIPGTIFYKLNEFIIEIDYHAEIEYQIEELINLENTIKTITNYISESRNNIQRITSIYSNNTNPVKDANEKINSLFD